LSEKEVAVMALFPNQPDEQFKEYAYEQVARIGKALSSPQRLILLNILCQGAYTVEALAGHAGLTMANASQHLQVLRAANLVQAERQGNHVQYSIADDRIRRFVFSLQEVAIGCLAELRQALAEISATPSRVESVGSEELMEKVSAGEAVAIDVRPASEYDAGHFPGSVSIPVQELERRLDELPGDGEVVALCRGRYCILADKAVAILREKGFRARRSDSTILDWETLERPEAEESSGQA